MTLYRCEICNAYEYDSEKGDSQLNVAAGTEPADFPADWACPICGSDKTHLLPA